MITEGEQGIAFEVDRRRINPEGVYRRMQETGHCPLRDYDIERIARAFGLYVGTMRQFIKKNGLDARLEDEVMGKFNYSEVEDLYNQGKSDTEIAKVLHISAPTVGMWRKRNGFGPNPPNLLKQVKKRGMVGQDRTVLDKQLVVDSEIEAAAVEMDHKADGWSIPEFTKTDTDAEQESIERCFAPNIDEPDPWEIIKQLEQQILFLRGVVIGAGIRDIDRIMQEAL